MCLVQRLAGFRELLQGKCPLAYGVHKDVCRGLVEDAQPVHFDSVAGNLVALHTLILDFTSKITLFSLITKEMVLKTSHFLLNN